MSKLEQFSFEKLAVYQKSLDLSVELTLLASKFPMKFIRLRDQLIGAVISVPLNIAEGSGRKSRKDQINFYKTARSSIFECIPIIEICYRIRLINNAENSNYREKIVTISKMLSGLINSLVI